MAIWCRYLHNDKTKYTSLRMKRLLTSFIMFILMASTAIAQELSYSLCFDGKNSRIRVELSLLPQRTGTETFTYGEPQFGGQNDIIDCFRDLRVKGAAEWSFDKDSRKISITPRAVGKKVVIRYDVIGEPTSEDDFQAELFRPMISETMLYCHGLNLFLTPESQNLMQRIHWKKKPSFPVVQLWQPDVPTSDTQRIHPMQVYMSLMVGSVDMDIESVKFQQVNGYVLTDLPENKQANRPLIADFFVRSMSALRSFWGEEETADTYVLSVLPFSERITHEAGGIALTGGFCSKYRPYADRDTILTPGIRFNLAHEMGHKWLGGTLSLGMENQWFHEGFNDYLTFVTLHESGLLNDDEYATLWNQMLDRYYGFPEHTLSNEKILENYWKIGEYNKLPYWRGCIFAGYLDRIISATSKDERSWRDFMRNLNAVCEKNGKITVNDFIRVLQPMLPPALNAKDLLDSHIFSGEDIGRDLVS